MKRVCICAFVLATLIGSPAIAGVYADTMGKCLVSATSDDDKAALVRWMFAGMTLHPSVASLSALTPDLRDEINKKTGQLFERLLTDACKKETSEALQYEGPMAMQLSFQILGQVASTSMLTNPKVAQGFSELAKYIDPKKLAELGKRN